MSKIFINYRREDSAPYAGRIYDKLQDYFGEGNIFLDIDRIEPGEDFVEVIENRLASVEIAIILIGKQWLKIANYTGQRRIDNPRDFVHIEIATLLNRKIRTIPVLVGGATFPDESELPDPIRLLGRKNAYEISDKRFHADIDILIKSIDKIVNPNNNNLKIKKISSNLLIEKNPRDKQRIRRDLGITFIMLIFFLIVIFSVIFSNALKN